MWNVVCCPGQHRGIVVQTRKERIQSFTEERRNSLFPIKKDKTLSATFSVRLWGGTNLSHEKLKQLWRKKQFSLIRARCVGMKASRMPFLSQLCSEIQSISCSVQTWEKKVFVLWFQQALTHTQDHRRKTYRTKCSSIYNNVLQWGTLFCSQLASAHLYFWQTASKILFELPVMWLTCCQWTRLAESCFSSEPPSTFPQTHAAAIKSKVSAY